MTLDYPPPPTHRISRRRVIRVLAACSLLPITTSAPWAGRGRASGRGVGADHFLAWRGPALGAEAEIVLGHWDHALARRAFRLCADEIARLERIFSLYLEGSEVDRLNREGILHGASQDLRILLAQARRVSALSGGAFDVTIQPLWRLYARHFAARPDALAGPPEAELERALALVDYRGIEVEGARVAFRRKGMAATFNGIAQGYITDRVADLLRDAGFEQVIVQLGETFAGLPPADVESWRIGVSDPRSGEPTLATVELVNQAVASSSGLATTFDGTGRHHHLLDAGTGRSPSHWLAASVVAPTAVVADAASTALMLLPPERADALLRDLEASRAILLTAAGSVRHWMPSSG